MLSRKQLLAVVLGCVTVIGIIVGAVVGTRNNSNSLSGSGTQASLQLCSGEACTSDPRACRSKFGFCGIGEAWCNADSMWRPDGCLTSVPQAGFNCTGQPCADMNLCRSQWGYCGTGSDYCNTQSVWNPQGCGSVQPPTTSGGGVVPTNAPINPTSPPSPLSSSCTGQECAAGQCRSEWGFCGTSPAYCNAKSTYTPACSTPTNPPVVAPPSTNQPSVPPTPPPTRQPTAPTPNGVTVSPTIPPTSPPTSLPTLATTKTPTALPTFLLTKIPTTSTGVGGDLLSMLRTRRSQISSILLQSLTPSNTYVQSQVYRAEDMEAGVRTALNGIAGMTFIGDGVRGRLNMAAFLAQSMKETIAYDVCDENNWDAVGGAYPASNSCGQLGQQYSNYKCSAAEKMMECPIDATMEKKAATNAQWYGAPGPLFCAPRSKVPLSPGWLNSIECNQPWASPPKTCTDYPGQKAGGFDFSKTYPSNAGRTDVEGCCWWGRGVIQLTGPCNIGKLNYFLGKAARDRGVADAPFPDVDFCKEPDAICASTKYPELKWVSGFFYWMRDVQAGDFGAWNYQNELTKLAANPNDVNARRTFINAVSGIVNRGSPFASNVDGGTDRANNFEKAWAILGPFAVSLEEGGTGQVVIPPLFTDDEQQTGVSAGAIAGGLVGALAVVGAAVFVVIRRRASSPTHSASGQRLAAANPMFTRM